jgi:hypothetical protein
MTLPEITTPKALAQHLGWPERRVRRIAKALGACIGKGKYMRLLNKDVEAVKATATVPEVEDKRTFQPDGSSVYFIAVRGFIKIGWSRNWRVRIDSIQVSNPEPIEILLILERPKTFEWEFHKKFAAHRGLGEWFKDHPEIRAYIEEHKGECRAQTSGFNE